MLWLTLALLAASGAVLIHMQVQFYPQGHTPFEVDSSRRLPPSTSQVIEWLWDGTLTSGTIAVWAALAMRYRGRWPAGVALGAAAWFVVAVGNVYLHNDVPAGGVQWHCPPWWFWSAWRWSVRGSWLLTLVLVIRSRLRTGAGAAPGTTPGT